MVAQLPQIWLVLRSAIWDARTPRSGVSERKKRAHCTSAIPEHGTRRMLTTEEIRLNNQLKQQQPKTSATRAAATAPATPATRAAATARREGGQGLTRKAPAPTPPETLVRAASRRVRRVYLAFNPQSRVKTRRTPYQACDGNSPRYGYRLRQPCH